MRIFLLVLQQLLLVLAALRVLVFLELVLLTNPETHHVVAIITLLAADPERDI
jgi:hypothetical protein